jgi:hypothetical protein
MNAVAPEKTDKILHLTGELASQGLRARAMGRPITRMEALALTNALHLLQVCNIALPNILMKILNQHDDLCAYESTDHTQREGTISELISLSQVNALPQRIRSMLGSEPNLGVASFVVL